MSKQVFSSFNIIGSNMSNYLEKYKRLLELDATLLITGETGTGKELMARWVHFTDATRLDKPFVKITIPNIGENIFESEVFGYEKGAFTGAISSKKGLIEVAENGTVFIDEIENASPSVQSKLLQLLEDKLYRKVGGTDYFYTEARFVIATNVDLYQEVLNGNFRSDLYYRLAVLEIKLPPLNERGEDILDIANYYIDFYNNKFKKNIKYIEKTQLNELLSYEWSGNIRELRNFIERSIVFSQDDKVDLSTLKDLIRSNTRESKLEYKDYISLAEKEYIQDLYNKYSGRVELIAKHMAMSIPFVYKKLKEHGIN